MSHLAAEFEQEALPEFEWEGEFEQEQFFASLADQARKAAASPALQKIAAQAARAALSSLPQEGEFEGEFEGEGPRDSLYSPIRKIYPDALMEHMAHRASLAESEAEATEAFLPLIPMLAAKLAPLALKALPAVGKAAAKLAPKVFQGVSRVAPQLTKGVNQVVGTLFRNKATRPLLRTIPQIARSTTAQIARQVAHGRPVTPQSALRVLAGQTARVLSQPGACLQAYQRSRRLDQAMHRVYPALQGKGPKTPRCGCARPPVCPHCGR